MRRSLMNKAIIVGELLRCKTSKLEENHHQSDLDCNSALGQATSQGPMLIIFLQQGITLMITPCDPKVSQRPASWDEKKGKTKAFISRTYSIYPSFLFEWDYFHLFFFVQIHPGLGKYKNTCSPCDARPKGRPVLFIQSPSLDVSSCSFGPLPVFELFFFFQESIQSE